MQALSHWCQRAGMLMPPLPWDRPRWRDHGGDPVVLLHGLWRGLRAMEPLARHLGTLGFSTLNLPYPSSRLPMPELLDHLRREISKIATDKPVHFVTHSLGGILARALLAGQTPWKTGRLLMLAPPNHGSEIVDWFSRIPTASFILGPAGRTLGRNGFPASLPALPPGLEAAVIMGNHPAIPFFKRLLEEENDGIVSTSLGRMEGLRNFAVLDADHTFIPSHPDVTRICPEFLRTGTWPG